MWEDVIGFEGLYQVSDQGEIRSIKRTKQNNRGFQEVNERIRVLTPDRYGYLKVCLSKDGKHYVKSVHRLVAEAFIPNPNNLPEINHKNEDKQDNRVENLEWCTQAYNMSYGGYRNRQAISQGRAVIQFDGNKPIAEYYSTQEASRQTGIPQGNIYKACTGKRRIAGGYEWRFKDEY